MDPSASQYSAGDAADPCLPPADQDCSAPGAPLEPKSTPNGSVDSNPSVAVGVALGGGEGEGADEEEVGFMTPKGSEASVGPRVVENCTTDVEKGDEDHVAEDEPVETSKEDEASNTAFEEGADGAAKLPVVKEDISANELVAASRIDETSEEVLEEGGNTDDVDARASVAAQEVEALKWGLEEDGISYGVESSSMVSSVEGKMVDEVRVGENALAGLPQSVEKEKEGLERFDRDGVDTNDFRGIEVKADPERERSYNNSRNSPGSSQGFVSWKEASEVELGDDNSHNYLSARASRSNERRDEVSEMGDEFRYSGSSTERFIGINTWKGVLEKEDQEGDENGGNASPGSSGYAGDPGSSQCSDEIEEADDGQNITVDDLTQQKHTDEDDGSASWRKRKKHFFILSNSGKPIYSRYGDEHKLAGFSATLQAIISFVDNSGDRIKFVRAGKHLIVFVVKGPIYLVCISSTEEPYEALRGQLELMYGQVLLILTKSIDRCFEKNPKYDMAPLLGGTDAVFSSLAHDFSRNPATFLHAFTCIPLPLLMRQATTAVLQDVVDSGNLFALLMCGKKVISLVGAQKASLHPDDILLLANFVLSSESFRTSESFSPICLPRYNPMAFLYAYVHFLHMNDNHERDIYLVLLTNSSDSFYLLKDCRIRVENVLLKSNILSEIQRSSLESSPRVDDIFTDGLRSPSFGQSSEISQNFTSQTAFGGPAGLWHFLYKSVNLDQYISSQFPLPISSSKQQKLFCRAYKMMHASMHDRETGPHKTQYRRSEDFVLFCWVSPEFELYAAFDPLADKAMAIRSCNRICQWVREKENEIFLYGDSTFSW